MVQVAIALATMVGFAAMAVDVGLMYSAKADLQAIADSAALAASSQLGNFTEAEAQGVTVLDLARDAAVQYGEKNQVFHQEFNLDDQDIEFGWSTWNDTEQRFTFEAAPAGTTNNINGVRVTARRTEGSSNGPLSMAFAGIFGLNQVDIAASAVAILVPRDIIIVADMSGSYNDDSELKSYANNDPDGVNLFEVWKTLPSNSANGALLEAWLEANPGMTVADAPASLFRGSYGFFNELGATGSGSVEVFGKTTINSGYDPATDDGLILLRRKKAWNSAELGSADHTKLRDYLLNLGYSNYEVQCIMADTGDPGTDDSIRLGDADAQSFASEYSDRDRYDLRVAVALGLMYWNSGTPGGLWESHGWTPGSGGWGIAPSELLEREPYPYPSGNWLEYVQYMRDANGSNWAVDELPAVKYRFGAKTFANFLLEEKELNSETDVAHYATANPLSLTKNALDVLMNDLASLDSGDHIGLVTYGTYAVLDYPIPCDSSDSGCSDPVTLEDNTAAVKDIYRHRQAAHYTPATNIGEGIDFARDCLSAGPTLSAPGAYQSAPDFGQCRPRPGAQKVVVVLTDGMANTGPAPSYTYGPSTGYAYAEAAAQQAWELARARIYGVGVGSAADMDLMDAIAAHGHTNSGYWANGSWSEIQSELEGIFQKIGGNRPVQLIE